MPTATTPVDMRTDNEGRFKIQNLTPAAYQLVVEAQGFTNHVLHDVNVTDGAEAQVGDIKMTRGGSLRGTLFDPAGKPLSGGTISLRPAPNSGLMVYYDVKSGQDGKFLFANVQPGTYVLSGSRGGGGEANPLEIFKDVHASQKQVTIADDESKVLDLPLSE
jgi:protocatechuate 3,4-dioxygenase beta subunit